MAVYTVTVAESEGLRGTGDADVLTALDELRLTSTATARRDLATHRDDVYFLRVPEGTPRETIERFAEDFLVGAPSRTGAVREGIAFPDRTRDEAAIIVQRRTGVMDPVSSSVLHALADAGISTNCDVRTARRHRIKTGLKGPTLSRDVLHVIATSHLSNAVVDECHSFLAGEEESLPDPFRAAEPASAERTEVPLREFDDDDLMRVSEGGGLSLMIEEMRAIQAHFVELGRDPTDVELESLAQTWSEHCCHKTLTGPINYGKERIENLLKETIFAATVDIDAPWCWSVFEDNAGVIGIDEEWGLTIKVETHNHPSALEPYGGAGTGIGGVIRDTMGTGRGAFPVLNMDVFCFGPLEATTDNLPPGTLHPRRLLSGVVAGVRDYGNRMGIPTANGAIYFHPGYIGNPLVFVGSVGLIPRDKVAKEVAPGDLIVAMGGRTGRDGIHGATFSSRELTEESESVSSGAVQIGNPIEEKKVLDALMRARDEDLYRGLTDCGAGGFSSAVGEMGEKVGARVDLSRAPLKYAGLTPCEIWISEAQERMVLAVPPENRERLFEILAEEEVEGCVLGEFTGDGQLRLFYGDTPVGELSMKFLHDGRPKTERTATAPRPVPHAEPDYQGATIEDVLLAHLDHGNIASKEPVIRQYDHEVQGRMVLRPLTGPGCDAPNDGCAFSPHRDDASTVVVGCGLQPLLGEIDPYQMGAQSVDEAIRNVVASGGTLDRLAVLDNFAWGNVHDPEILGAIVECARGAADAARAFGTPFVSGKDSLHNTYRAGGVSRSIPHTLLVTACSVVDGPSRAPSSDVKHAGSVLLLVGPAEPSLAGSTVQLIYGGVGGVPVPFDPKLGLATHRTVSEWIGDGRVHACHDLSDGGLAVAAAEMAMGGGGLGVTLDPTGLPGMDPINVLFGEGPHRYLIEVSPSSEADCLAAGIPVHRVGEVTEDGSFCIARGAETTSVPVSELCDRWRAPLQSVWPLDDEPVAGADDSHTDDSETETDE